MKHTVVVTGFGPFANHDVNASWECVKELEKIGLGDDIELIVLEIPVEYDAVKKQVPDLWANHKPDLMVHVGVSGIAKEITLEQQGHNDGYDREDVKGCKIDSACCINGADNVIVSELNMEHVQKCVNESEVKANAIVSHDPGRYLCDFVYFNSLHKDRKRSAFIHVPKLEQPYTAMELAEGIRVAILSMLEQTKQLSVVSS